MNGIIGIIIYIGIIGIITYLGIIGIIICLGLNIVTCLAIEFNQYTNRITIGQR